jgi:hypothetical protein
MFLNGVNRQNVCSVHVGAALVRPQSLRALGGIAGEADNKYPLMRHLDLILASMQRHSASAVVQVRPCMAVWAMRPLHVSLNALHGGADSPPSHTRVSCVPCTAAQEQDMCAPAFALFGGVYTPPLPFPHALVFCVVPAVPGPCRSKLCLSLGTWPMTSTTRRR